MFKELNKKEVKEVESSILKFWKENKIFEKSNEIRKDAKDFVFYDGPIYANAAPGIHHVLAKTIKDTFTKYKVMRGYRVDRKIGLDTHGLPIEVNVEKKLGFKSKSDIEEFGIENFCKECNKATATNIDEINKLTDMMGQFIDCEDPYITCTNDFIESEWWLLKEMDKKGLLYYGNKVLWYCPRCGTELSQNEVGQGYQQDPVNSIIIPFKKKDKEEYFLVWTTTPWTLLANVALCVNPELTYVKVKSMGYTFIMAQSLVKDVLGEEIEVLETYKGTDLVGEKYEQLLPYVDVEGKCFEVVADNYVSDGDGTGIVHIAPAYGQDDNRVCHENGIGFINPVGPDGCYTEGPWVGRLVTDPELEVEIIKHLKENDKLFRKIKLMHDYPHCWRCKSALISYPKPAWYIRTTEYKDKIIEANKKINWYPDYVGTKRFADWLDNMIDWGISRSRYWGCPLPIWICECGEKKVIGSVEELQNEVIEDVNVKEIELHRPYVDELHLKCSCGKTMERVKDVVDVWFDSGAMPYAQFHYPFENKELFERQFPADFIAEGLDQTRGWFNSLLCISTIISGESSFKNVVVNDMVLDEKGKKMSKSTGNVVDPIEAIEKYGADNVRWYMLYASPVWTPLKFDIEGLKEVYSKFFNPLKNTYSFFALYGNIDNIDIKDCDIEVSKRSEIDKWLLSRYNSMLKEVTSYYEEYDLHKVTRAVSSFVSDDLSNWYIRRCRNRFWGSEFNDDKKSVYMTTYEVLDGLARIIAPVAPYVSEEIYQNLTGNESVHLADFPEYDESLINPELEEKMDLVRSIISVGRYVREENKIKVRQPLPEALIDGKNENVLSEVVDLISEELNVKKVVFAKDLNEYMHVTVKPNFKEAGKVIGKDMKEYQTKLESLSESDITALQKGESITMEIGGNKIEVTPELVDIKYSAKEGFNVGMENGNFIILDTRISEELKMEGNAREFISKVQALRKENDFDIEDRIITTYNADDEFKKSIENNLDYIKNETLSVELIYDEKLDKTYKLNDYEVGIELERK